jgi:hypothetical protein
MKKDLKALIRQAVDAGCSVRDTKGGHLQILIPGGGIVTVSSSPSDHHALKNARGDLRRAGLDI